MGQRLLIRNTQAPGDIIVLSAAIRDLAVAHPGRYDVEIWVSRGAEHVYWNSPYVSRIHTDKHRPDNRGAVAYRAQYPLISRSNQERKHFILGFIEHMNATLGTKIVLTEFRPSITMSEAEKATRPFEDPYWIFLSGGKKDYPTKIWAQSYWQQVIDATKDRVNWVQCGGGSSNHIMHTPKRGIYANMIAKTDCRNFLRLIYHSEGVVCVTTMAMHAAAAFNKPCIVVEGGREPWWWEAYNEETRRFNMRVYSPLWEPPATDDFVPHKYLHTIGQLPCCQSFGCWKKRVTGGGSVCKNVVLVDGQTVPKCKSMISPEMVIAAIDGYIDDGLARRAQARMINTPYMSMSTPDAEPTPVTSQPAMPPMSRQQQTPAEINDMRFCLYGGGTISLAGPKVSTINHGTPRMQALRELLKHEENWIVWIEQGISLHDDWLRKLSTILTEPVIVGRMHCTPTGQIYPYPAFFVVHRNLVVAGCEFSSSFRVDEKHFRRLGDLVRMSTVPVQP